MARVNIISAVLAQVPNGFDVVIKGRECPIISCTIPIGAIPKGWTLVQSVHERDKGYLRIRYGYQQGWAQVYPTFTGDAEG